MTNHSESDSQEQTSNDAPKNSPTLRFFRLVGLLLLFAGSALVSFVLAVLSVDYTIFSIFYYLNIGCLLISLVLFAMKRDGIAFALPFFPVPLSFLLIFVWGKITGII